MSVASTSKSMACAGEAKIPIPATTAAMAIPLRHRVFRFVFKISKSALLSFIEISKVIPYSCFKVKVGEIRASKLRSEARIHRCVLLFRIGVLGFSPRRIHTFAVFLPGAPPPVKTDKAHEKWIKQVLPSSMVTHDRRIGYNESTGPVKNNYRVSGKYYGFVSASLERLLKSISDRRFHH